jgi:predicted amidohydrolase
MTLRIALVQMAVVDGDPAVNVARAEALVRAAPQADVYLLPELFTTATRTTRGPAPRATPRRARSTRCSGWPTRAGRGSRGA